MKKTTKEEFIEKAKKIHKNKYDYSKVEYVNTHIKVCIICPKHGEFWQTPHEHLKGCGCKKCSNEKEKITFDEFIKRSRQIHKDKYDYSKVEYINTHTKVCIICPEHGEFWQLPNSHLGGYGCLKCGHKKTSNKKILSTKTFIERAKAVHGNKYDYSKVEYIGNKTRVCIICPEHGEFWQTPDVHLRGCGCKECYNKHKRGKSRQHNINWFIEKGREIHGNKYDYSKAEYKGCFDKVCIICPEHGEFWQTPASHIWEKNGCAKCGNTYKSTTEEFINKSRKVHGNKYDYSKVVYKNNKTKVCIICPEHGEFCQTPNSHLNGNGCPKCKSSHLEREMRILLEKNQIDYEEQKTFEWLKFKKPQFLDFYIPKCKIAIECQGEQHFQKSGWGRGEMGEKVIKRDLNKLKLCEEHGIKVLYYTKLNINYPYSVFQNENEIIKEISEHL